jgi:hypothetical protein
VLFNQLFVGTTELGAGAVDEEMQRAGPRPAERRHLQRPASVAHRRMVRREIEPEERNDGADEPLCLP